jgi:hypothetical protein
MLPPVPTAVLPDPSITDAYRRAARRLRCRLAGQPGRLHRSLKALNEAPAAAAPASSVHRHTPCTVQYDSGPRTRPLADRGSASFADHVAGLLTSPILRYSQRLQFIRDARRFGISRFEANLVIAAVLERRRRSTTPDAASQRDGSLVSLLTTFVVVQGAVAFGAWWTLFR